MSVTRIWGGLLWDHCPAVVQESIRFGDDFEVDVRALELRQSGRVLKLEPIPSQILLFLIEQRGRLVTREEIVEKIWGGCVFLDTDNSINGAIRKIRQVLKDDPQQPRFVQTITGRGYRFIAPVIEDEASSTETEARDSALPREVDREVSGSPGVKSRTRRRVSLTAALSLCCVIAVAGFKLWEHFYGQDATRPIRSIAVLPLQNLSGDAAQEYFADGMTEELITELSRVQALRVISHTSVMEYKGTKKHLPQIARELGVDGVLEGSVVRENDQIRVTVQLLDGPHDRHLWSEAYERPMHGILDLQREVAQAVAQQIRIKLTPEQEARLHSVQTVNPEAYEEYLKGRYYLSNQFTTAQPLNEAKNRFEESIRQEPGFSSAYSGLANAYIYLAFFRLAPQEPAFRFAKEALRKALELDETNGEAYDALALMSWRYDRDLDAAQKEFNRSVDLGPSYSCAHEDRALFLGFLGRRAEALAEIAKSKEINPGPSSTMAEEGVYYQLRDYQGLVDASRRGVAGNPHEWVEHYNLGIGYEGTGKMLEAISEYQKAIEMSGGDRTRLPRLPTHMRPSGEGPKQTRSCMTLSKEREMAMFRPTLSLRSTPAWARRTRHSSFWKKR